MATYSKTLSILQKAFPDLLAVYQFGSKGTPYENKESDLDLAVLLEGKANPITLWETAQQLAVLHDQDVDLVDLRTVPTVFQHEILATGIPLYCKDKLKVGLFETFVDSSYLYLNEERAEILKDIQERGTVY